MSRVGRDESDDSIQVEKNLTGKLIQLRDALQTLPDKYLLSDEKHKVISPKG